MNSSESKVFSKVLWRLLPFLMLCYFVAFLDRSNAGFAKLSMSKDIGLSESQFGLGAGIFFIGYFLFEVPSNIILEKVGARRWIARIMILWGIISAATAYVWDANSFYIMRFVLGIGEAGFFPGIILYLTYWFPEQQRAKIVGSFMAAIPISLAVGSPLSGLILENFNGVSGYANWQWLYVLEALPAIVLGFVVLFYLTDKPEKASWLTAEERTIIANRLTEDRNQKEATNKLTLGEALMNGRVLALSLVYFGLSVGLYGVGFWMPSIIKGFAAQGLVLTYTQTGLMNAVPYIFGAIAMVLWTRNSDRTGERTFHVAIPAFIGSGALIWAAYAGSPLLSLVALTIAAMGIFCAMPTFWALPTSILTGTAAAGGLALINSIGGLGGYAGPQIIGIVKQETNGFTIPLLIIAGFMMFAGLLTLIIGQKHQPSIVDARI